MNKLIIITGQTATGKTSLAFKLAQENNGVLINCDSRQIYKYLDIITGKDYNLISKNKIGLYDVIKPDEYFSSFDYVKLALPLIKKIIKKGKTPIIVGGTYLYIKHLLYGVEIENIPPDWKLRKELGNKTVKELQKILTGVSTQLINQLNQSEKNNPQRLIRKIEILKSRAKGSHIQPRGLNMTLQSSKTNMAITLENKLSVKNLKIEFYGLKFKDKNLLRKTIKKRVEKRLKNGAVDEVKKLLEMGYTKKDPGLKTTGYQQLIGHLKGVLDIDTAIQQWINKEVQYAKRQYTFMKKDKNIKWREI